MNSALFVLLFSVLVLFVMNIPYKFLINQNEARAIKARVKELQEKSKYVRRQGNQKMASQIMGDSFRESSKLTKMSLKPMLLSLVIVFIALPLLSNAYSDHVVELKDNKSNITINGNTYDISVADKVITIGNVTCESPCMKKNIGGGLWNVNVNSNKVEFARIVALLPVSLPVFADDAGWLGWYLIISIPVMILQRKLMKIHV
ncbi:MAG: DUF106 domain-containing protein [Candidatus Aenigmarchaeota archaeon]|nr:DUF106 domain-containing protein [Candidatus Aenigmarchaeota archaeon]